MCEDTLCSLWLPSQQQVELEYDNQTLDSELRLRHVFPTAMTSKTPQCFDLQLKIKQNTSLSASSPLLDLFSSSGHRLLSVYVDDAAMESKLLEHSFVYMPFQRLICVS